MAGKTKKTNVASPTSTMITGKKKFSLSSLQKKLAVGAAIVLVAVGGYVGYALLQPTTTDAKSCVNRPFSINGVDRSICVKYAQAIMNNTDNTGKDIAVDAVLGVNTEAKIKRYQKAKDIRPVTGTLNKATWKKLCQRGIGQRSERRENMGCKRVEFKYGVNKGKYSYYL